MISKGKMAATEADDMALAAELGKKHGEALRVQAAIYRGDLHAAEHTASKNT